MLKVPSFVAALSVLPITSFAWSAAASDVPAAPSAPPEFAPPALAPAPLAPPGSGEPATPPAFDPAPSPDVDAFRYPRKSVGFFVSPIGLLFGVVGAEMDIKVASFATLNLAGDFTRYLATTSNGSTTTESVSGELGAQFYPFGRAFHRLYVYPRVSYGRSWSVETRPGSPDVSSASSALGMGATVGYQWTYDSGFSLRLGAGAMYFSAVGRDDVSTVEIALNGILPAIDASLGWTF